MNKTYLTDFSITLTIILLCIGLWALGFLNGQASERKKTIAAGAAEYIVNAKTGEIQFVYKSQKEQHEKAK